MSDLDHEPTPPAEPDGPEEAAAQGGVAKLLAAAIAVTTFALGIGVGYLLKPADRGRPVALPAPTPTTTSTSVAAATTTTFDLTTSPPGPPLSAGTTAASTAAVSTTTTAVTTTTTRPPTTTTKALTYQRTFAFSGSADKVSPPFEVTSTTARIAWDSKAATFSLFVTPVGSPEGQPFTSCTGACASASPLPVNPGRYYLSVKSTEGAWLVAVEELR